MLTKNYGLILGSIAYFTILIIGVNAGPASRRFEREVYPEIEADGDVNQSQVCIVGDLVYGINEAVPSEQPCLKCKCQPPGVQCEALRCANKKPGCKMVHRPNECCPDYQCECEYKGRRYSNGERLETSPGDECKVCYCRGGEIKCADLSCYVRNDCEGKQVPGQCCPKYDHCPTRDSLEKGVPNATFSLNPATPEENTFTNKPTTNLDSQPPQDADNKIQPDSVDSLQNSKITIQEIIPEILEIPITSNPKEEQKAETQGKLIIEETKATEENDLFVTDSEAESSELTEVIQSPPPVIRIGDNLLYLKRNELVNEKDASSTPSSIITLIGAEGLQRGGIEEVENATNQDVSTSFSPTTSEERNNDLEPASSSHILSLVKKKKKPVTSPPTPAPTTTLLSVSESQTFSSTEDSTQTPTVISAEPENVTETRSSVSVNATEPSVSDQTIILELDVNPAYPTQPEDVWLKPEMDQIVNQTIPRENQEKKFKILPEVLEIRNNRTVPVNTTHTQWLKEVVEEFTPMINLNAALPPEILSAPSETDETDVEEDDVSTTTTTSVESTQKPELDPNSKADLSQIDTLRSIESLETSGEDTGEQTTSETNAALTSNEDASVADDPKSSEVDDMIFVKEFTVDLSNDEEKQVNVSFEVPQEGPKTTDVEMIDVAELEKNQTSTPTERAPPEKVTSNRTITKRANDDSSFDESVFAELNQELGLGSTEKPKTPQEEEEEARKVFQELLDETSTPKSNNPPGAKTKEAESLEKVSQALAKLAFRGSQPLDTGVLGALRDFFSSQYKAYQKNAQ